MMRRKYSSSSSPLASASARISAVAFPRLPGLCPAPSRLPPLGISDCLIVNQMSFFQLTGPLLPLLPTWIDVSDLRGTSRSNTEREGPRASASHSPQRKNLHAIAHTCAGMGRHGGPKTRSDH